MRRELGRIWESSSASSEQLLHDLQAWCQRAQQSGIAGLEQLLNVCALRGMMLEKLNPEQRAAVTLEPQHALVLAGAAARPVLTTRMAWLIQTGQASPFGLLAVTFTNKAAREMLAIYQLRGPVPAAGVVDFAELLLRAYELLSRNAPVREHYQRRFRHILVDEFQDTNTLQYKWLRLLAGGGAAIFAVGDDDQSIYAFRGANVGNMADFERDYAHGTVIRLEQNYRSYGHILDSANALIGHNSGRLGKNLWTEQGEGEPVRVIEQPSDGMEAQWVVDEIRSLIHEGSLRREIAVFYRSNAQSRVLEHAIFSAGIPYKVYGGLRFFERQEIKHALAYLRLMANPQDDTSLMRVVNFPRAASARARWKRWTRPAPMTSACIRQWPWWAARAVPTWCSSPSSSTA